MNKFIGFLRLLLMKDERLIVQYRKRQKIEQTKAKLNSNRIYQKIKEDINNDESAPFEHTILMDDSLEDIDVTAHRFNIDYDIIHKDYRYRVIFNPYHQYQSKRIQQIQQFVNQKVRKEENWLTLVNVGGITLGFTLLAIGLMPCFSIISTVCWVTVAGLIMILSTIYSSKIIKKIKHMTANLPKKASDIKL